MNSFNVPGAMTCDEIRLQRQERRHSTPADFDSRRSSRFVRGQQVTFLDDAHCRRSGRITNIIDNYGAFAYHIAVGSRWYRYVDQQQIIS
jgi:hypothetical protein